MVTWPWTNDTLSCCMTDVLTMTHKTISENRLHPWLLQHSAATWQMMVNHLDNTRLCTCLWMAPVAFTHWQHENMTSSAKPEAHNTLYCCHRRTQSWPQVTCVENFVNSEQLVFETCRWTDRHTDRHEARKTLHSSHWYQHLQTECLLLNSHPQILLTYWVKILHLTGHKTGHLRHVLPSQSLGLVLKKLNLTQQKQTTQEQNGKNYTKGNPNR